METLCGNDPLGCRKVSELHGDAFCMVRPAVMNDEDSLDDDFTCP